MSGFQTQVLTPITYGQPLPANQSPKSIQFSVLWSASNVKANNNSIDINLLQQYQTNQFTTCMSVYIDNSTNPNSITLTCDQTQQTVFCKGFSQGYFPLICSFQPSFTAQNFPVYDPGSQATAENFTTNFYFLNIPIPSYKEELKPVVSANNYFDFTLNTVNIIQPIMPLNTTIGQQYLIYSFDLTLTLNGSSLPAASFAQINIAEMGGANQNGTGSISLKSYVRWVQYLGYSALGQTITWEKTFSPPMITRNNNSNNLSYNNLGIYFPIIPSGCSVYVQGNISYGIIQTG